MLLQDKILLTLPGRLEQTQDMSPHAASSAEQLSQINMSWFEHDLDHSTKETLKTVKHNSPAMEITKPGDHWSAGVRVILLIFCTLLLETGVSPGYPHKKWVHTTQGWCGRAVVLLL